MQRLLIPVLLFISFTAIPHSAAYDETADARRDVSAALQAAQASHQRVLLIFGANWCADCRALDESLAEAHNAALLAEQFRVVKIDVGDWDKNQDLDAAYGHPTRGGIPAAVLVSPDNHVLYSTQAGELANARRLDAQGVYGFFSNVLTRVASTTH